MTMETHEPTPSEAMAISMAGAEAAQEADTPQEAQEAVSAAVEQKARELKVTLDPDAAKLVGKEVISQLEAMGAFREPEPEVEEVDVQQVQQEQIQQVSNQIQDPPAPKKNWIQRLVGDD